MNLIAYLSRGRGSYDVLVDSNNPNYVMENGVLYGKNSSGSKNYKIYSSVSSSRYTDKVVFENRVEDEAFAYTKRTKFYLSSAVSSIYIGHYLVDGLSIEEAKKVTFYAARSSWSSYWGSLNKLWRPSSYTINIIYSYSRADFDKL